MVALQQDYKQGKSSADCIKKDNKTELEYKEFLNNKIKEAYTNLDEPSQDFLMAFVEFLAFRNDMAGLSFYRSEGIKHISLQKPILEFLYDKKHIFVPGYVTFNKFCKGLKE